MPYQAKEQTVALQIACSSEGFRHLSVKALAWLHSVLCAQTHATQLQDQQRDLRLRPRSLQLLQQTTFLLTNPGNSLLSHCFATYPEHWSAWHTRPAFCPRDFSELPHVPFLPGFLPSRNSICAFSQPVSFNWADSFLRVFGRHWLCCTNWPPHHSGVLTLTLSHHHISPDPRVLQKQ